MAVISVRWWYRAEDVGDGVGDVGSVVLARVLALFDLDAAAWAEPVDEVARVVAAVALVGARHPNGQLRGEDAIDGLPQPFFQLVRRCSTDQHAWFVVEAVEGHGVGEAPRHHGGEEGETVRVEVGGRDVPAIEGSAVGPPALRPPGAGQVRAEALDHPLGLFVGVLFDVATVRGDGDEVGLGAIVVEPLDQFAGIAGVVVAQLLIDNLGVEGTLELSSSDRSRRRPPRPMRTTASAVSCSSSLTV